MQMSARAEAFDRWIRGAFVAINTELEELYFRQDDRSRVEGVGDPLKARLRDEGHVHVIALLEEGNTGDGFASAFNVLGNVGLYQFNVVLPSVTPGDQIPVSFTLGGVNGAQTMYTAVQ